MTKAYKRILCTVDFRGDYQSPECIVGEAKKLAELFNGELILMNVVPSFPAYAGVYSGIWEFEEKNENEAKERMEKLAKVFDIADDRVLIKKGLSKYRITEVAQELEVDLVVMGHHQHTHLFGSTSRSVVNDGSCDYNVLIVKEQNITHEEVIKDIRHESVDERISA